MMQKRGDEGHLLGAVAIFIVMTLLALTMLLFALILYLSELIGSLIGAMIIIGSLAALVAFVLYVAVVKPQFMAIREQISTIYEMAHLARCGYDWVLGRVETFLKSL